MPRMLKGRCPSIRWQAGRDGWSEPVASSGALWLSPVATLDGDVVGHAAFSPVQIDGAAGVWWGLARSR